MSRESRRTVRDEFTATAAQKTKRAHESFPGNRCELKFLRRCDRFGPLFEVTYITQHTDNDESI